MDPEQALGVAAQWSFKEPAKPDLTTFYEGSNQYQGYLGPDGKPVRVTSDAPRWQPPQPKGPSEMKQRALDAGLVPGTPEYRNFMLTGGGQAKIPGITTLYGPNGEVKSAYENDPAIPGMMQSGWTAVAPKDAKTPDLVTLTKAGETKTILKSDPQLGMYLGAGWLDANAAPKTAGIVTRNEISLRQRPRHCRSDAAGLD